jgi:uncharacterized protein YbjT (DUF2867 family)
MALTATQIQARIDSLQAAMNAGVLVVQHGTDRVQYQSYSDMARALNSLKAQLDEANGITPRARVNYIRQSNKGFSHGINGLKDFS